MPGSQSDIKLDMKYLQPNSMGAKSNPVSQDFRDLVKHLALQTVKYLDDCNDPWLRLFITVHLSCSLFKYKGLTDCGVDKEADRQLMA